MGVRAFGSFSVEHRYSAPRIDVPWRRPRASVCERGQVPQFLGRGSPGTQLDEAGEAITQYRVRAQSVRPAVAASSRSMRFLALRSGWPRRYVVTAHRKAPATAAGPTMSAARSSASCSRRSCNSQSTAASATIFAPWATSSKWLPASAAAAMASEAAKRPTAAWPQTTCPHSCARSARRTAAGARKTVGDTHMQPTSSAAPPYRRMKRSGNTTRRSRVSHRHRPPARARSSSNSRCASDRRSALIA